jgi:protein TonB
MPMFRIQVLSLALAISMTVAAASASETAQPSSSDQDVVSASTLTRTYAIQPTWPAAATGVEGWVRLRFTVLPDGTVTDIVVEESDPASVFETSAVDALRQWKFEPVQRDGK